MRYLPLFFCLSLAAQAAVRQESFRFSPERFEWSESFAAAYVVVTADGMNVTSEPGLPQLPAMPVSIELPGRNVVKGVRVVVRGWDELGAGVAVLPAQKQDILSRREAVFGFTAPDPDVYQSERSYPSDCWLWTGTGMRRGNTVVDLVLYPVRFFGAAKRLEYCRGFDVVVEYEPFTGHQPSVTGGQNLFEYLVVTGAQYDSIFRRLASWKTEKGVPSAIRHIDWVYANYSGRDNAERLRNYLKTLPDSGVTYVLLGGDVSVVPFRKAFAMKSEGNIHPREDSLPCDLYFADLDGDWDANGNNIFGEMADSIDLYPDLVVGRAPVDNPAKARAFVNKALEYEQGPAQAKQQNALFFAEVMWSDPYTDGGVHKNRLEALAFKDGYNVTKLYQSRGNQSRTSVMAGIRQGHNYLNHSGHGWIDVMSCGGYPHYLRTRDADTITNVYRGIIFSIGCWTTAFDEVSIGEAFVTNPNGGTVATVGNSSYGWGSPGNPGFGYSEKFDDKFWWMVQRTGNWRVGDALAESKAHFAPFSRGENVYRWHQYELNLMGCPEMPVWTSVPDTLRVTGPDEIPPGAGRVLVAVESRGRAVKGATVCLMKAGESYAVAQTNAAGTAWLSVEPHSGGSFKLTVTAKNHLPAQRTIQSGAGSFVNFAGWVINDSLGNNDGIPNENETVFLPVLLHNAGHVPTGVISLRLRTDDPLVTITDSAAVCVALAPGESTFIANAFGLSIGPCSEDGKLVRFELTIGDTAGTRTFRPVLQLGLPKLERVGHFYRNPPALPGMDVPLKVVIDNRGHGFGHGTRARLVSLDQYVTVLAPETILVGEIGPGSRFVPEDSFTVSIAGSCPGAHLADMRLDLRCEGYSFQHGFRLLVGNYGFSDDMESGPDKWTHGGTGDKWHLSRHRWHSGTTAWYCGDGATRSYYPNMNAWLISRPFMVAENCTLRFWRWFSVPNYGVDGIYVIIVRGAVAETLDFIGTGGALRRLVSRAEDGIESDWFEEEFDLSWLAPGETVQVKIGFKSDGDADVGEGFYIDDVRVTGGNPPPTFVREENGERGVGNRAALLTASPNPFRNSVVLRMEFGVERSALLRIYDAGGRCVRSFPALSVGREALSVVWDGRDDSGRRVPTGTYFVRVQVGGGSGLVKVLLAQ